MSLSVPHAQLRGGEEHAKSFDVRVQTPGSELRQNPFGVVFVVGRADVVRICGQTAHVLAHVVGHGKGAELLFPLAFRARALVAVAAKGSTGVGRKAAGGAQRRAEQDA